MEVILSIFLLTASIIALISSIGILKMPDLMTKMASTSVTSTLGATLIFVSASLISGNLIFILGLLFIFLSSPVLSHILGHLGYRYKLPISPRTQRADQNKITQD